MSTRYSEPTYICDRCGQQVQLGRYPDTWGTYLIPQHSKGPLMPGTFVPKRDTDLCQKCIRSLTKWMEDGDT